MAIVKKCRRAKCKSPINPPNAETCHGCGRSDLLEPVNDPDFVVCRVCNSVQGASEVRCASCGSGLKRVARLRFPWGEQRLDQGIKLMIGRNGREVPPALASHLAVPAYRTVSRLHAELYWLEGQLVVRDLNSRNGTFVDDARLNPGGEYSITGVHQLRLSSRLEIGISFDQ